MAELVAKRYATSLFEVGRELNQIDDFHNQLEYIGKVFESEKKLLQILEHPRISNREKRTVVEELFKQGLSEEVLNFLFIIIDKRREDSLMEILREYNILFKEYKGILDIEAVTAVSMKDSSVEKLKLALKKKFNKEINLLNSVDPSIIGGVLLKMDSKVIDSTLKSQLKEMESLIKEASL